MENLIRQALDEDIGSGDVSADLIPQAAMGNARLIVRETAVLCGTAYFTAVCTTVDPRIQLHWFCADGEVIEANQSVCEISGPCRAILTAERTALNFLQTLSGTATKTYQYAEKIKHTKAKILDTRKTLPGFRQAQKYAVRCGGGHNQRMGLYDAVLIKENHIMAAGSIKEAVARARGKYPHLPLEVEVENLRELQEALSVNVARILLDNFSVALLSEAAAMTAGRAELEASGGVSLENVKEIAETGVDYISIGALTKDIKAVDFSLRMQAGRI